MRVTCTVCGHSSENLMEAFDHLRNEHPEAADA